MSFFQNCFDTEFRGNWVLADRQYSLTFTCPANRNTSNFMIAYNKGPYDFSADNTLTINYAYDIDFKAWSALSINVAGATAAATTVYEVVAALNANTTFASMWLAVVQTYEDNPCVLIRSKLDRPKQVVKTYISNGGAETKLNFNRFAGVSELPTYFERHTIAERFDFPDSVNQLILLDNTDPVDQDIIEQAGFVPGNMLADWELLRGRASGLFKFRNQTVDGSGRLTEVIEYGAGAQVGDFARKTQYVYSGANTVPSEITEIPHVLVSGDLITP
jgi:hypothetical protein